MDYLPTDEMHQESTGSPGTKRRPIFLFFISFSFTFHFPGEAVVKESLCRVVERKEKPLDYSLTVTRSPTASPKKCVKESNEKEKDAK